MRRNPALVNPRQMYKNVLWSRGLMVCRIFVSVEIWVLKPCYRRVSDNHRSTRRAFGCLSSGCLCVLLHLFPAWLSSCAGGWCSVLGGECCIAGLWKQTRYRNVQSGMTGERRRGVGGKVSGAASLLMDRAAGLSAKSAQRCLQVWIMWNINRRGGFTAASAVVWWEPGGRASWRAFISHYK